MFARFGREQILSADEQFVLSEGIERRVEVVVMGFSMLPQFVIGTSRVATLHTRLARYFGCDAHSWLNLQATYDLRRAEIANARKIEREIMPVAV